MAEQNVNGLIAAIDAILGGAGTLLFSAATARIIYHGQQVRKGVRPMFGWNLLFEAPLAIGMALVGDAFSDYMGFNHHVSVGIVAILAYKGPEGVQRLAMNFFGSKTEKETSKGE
jgi:hypothetical protein